MPGDYKNLNLALLTIFNRVVLYSQQTPLVEKRYLNVAENKFIKLFLDQDFLLAHLHRGNELQVLAKGREMSRAQRVRLHVAQLPRLLRRPHVHERQSGKSRVFSNDLIDA